MTGRLNLCTFFYKLRRPLSPYQTIPIVFSSNTDSSDYLISDQEYIRDGFSFDYLPENAQEQRCVLGPCRFFLGYRRCVLSASNGLLPFRYCNNGDEFCYLIWNPLTRKWRELYVSAYGNDEHESHVLVCESSSSTWNTNPVGFKVVCIPEIKLPAKKFYLRIFSSGTGKWKNHKVLCSDKITMLYEDTKKVVSDQSERLYWIIETNKIIAYDIKNRVGGCGECMLIDLPKNEEEDDYGSPSAAPSCLTVSEGCIFYIRIESKQMNVSIWLLEEENDDSSEQWSWKVVQKINVNEMLAGSDWNNTRITNLKPLGFSPLDRNVVFLQSDEYIFQYNILTRRSQLLSISSHLRGPISSYEFEVLPFLATSKPTIIPVIRRA
ncbi:uncharacterized protein LOC113331577 isoform X1 [Papaver somniferum]|uniref:uncharacterized protein LOC113331577 isoform X1 n=1 Tax=Papaver somniferum TaxID=3469 RepID=UPI000E6F931C|nr:uncharacterized protein LOC113331577 isoform X1 [Papaver somniferum]XP_026434057.1 uncharacterized protein LOC113331577 isoform X1 [Papaver somniferum]XP_026434058.1 uncharacterized protein LOC113331577 isoform X1 [Papaver somniferum]XP_026434059.1 uncharacterized protein LOC113331577 isoform X1 [Papaver somniferum]XP_026434060.1 uncharacterized protein LOC113331577 isoform X1 [Papaver somniferum]XP_026434061.1 uncharacterized protein LOC113331577 isoform X1 [Papaver somniferum]